jgi:hypothetical protein
MFRPDPVVAYCSPDVSIDPKFDVTLSGQRAVKLLDLVSCDGLCLGFGGPRDSLDLGCDLVDGLTAP